MITHVMMDQMKTSPCDLIQEYLVDLPDPTWCICVACMLMNMTRGLTMRPYMWRLFERWSTPYALAHADAVELAELIRPLGFVNKRTKALIAMSNAYIEGTWRTPSDLPGCGKYATDSWRIFVRHENIDVEDLHDKELRRYVHWARTGIYVPQGKGRNV